ncbi:hypothetical protein [Carboxylicivirga sp. N1Y90]|nr:hypothetical protein [Marinilabiliaceae bacterium N1Y90]
MAINLNTYSIWEFTPASDDVVDRPIPGNPDTEYAPQRPTPGGPNPE